MNKADVWALYGALLLVATTVAACGGSQAPSRPVERPYRATFNYPITQAATPVDVAIAVVAPEFSDDSSIYWDARREDETIRRTWAEVEAGFYELMTAKGFSVAGPYDSLELMTYPEKQAVDLVVYPAVDLFVEVHVTNQTAELEGNAFTGYDQVLHCDMVLSGSGVVQLLAVEPLSGQRMWVHSIDLDFAPNTFRSSGRDCQGGGEGPQGLRNAWARMHEHFYTDVMTGLDRYVSPEEFVALQAQARDVRESTRF